MTKLHITRLALCFAVYSLFIGDVCAMFRRSKTSNTQPPQTKENIWDFSFDADVSRNDVGRTHKQKLPELLVLGLEYIECRGMKIEGIFRQPKKIEDVKRTLGLYGKHVKSPPANHTNAPGSPSNAPESDSFALDTPIEFHVLNAGTLLKLYFNSYKQPLFPNEMLYKIIKFGLQLNTDVQLIGKNRPKVPGRSIRYIEKNYKKYKDNEKEKFVESLKQLVNKIHTEFPKNIPGIRMNIADTAGMQGVFPKLTNERIRAFRHLAQTAFLVVECSQFTKINFSSLGALWGATLFHVDDAHLRNMEFLGRDEKDNGMDTMGSPLTYLYQETVVKAVTAELFRYFDVLFDPLPGHEANEPTDVKPWCRNGSPPQFFGNMCNDPEMMPSIMHPVNGRWRVNHPVLERVNFKQEDERTVK